MLSGRALNHLGSEGEKSVKKKRNGPGPHELSNEVSNFISDICFTVWRPLLVITLWLVQLFTPLFHISQGPSTILKLPKQVSDYRKPPSPQVLRRATRNIFPGKVPKLMFSDLKEVQPSLET